MGVLLKNEKFNWLPNNSVHRRLLADILKVIAKDDDYKWLEKEVLFIKDAHLYTLDFRDTTDEKILDFIEVISRVIFLNEGHDPEDEVETIYHKQLLELRNNLRHLYLANKKNE